jgi:hypothetical protein
LIHRPGREISIFGMVPVAITAMMHNNPEIRFKCSLPVSSINSTVRLESRKADPKCKRPRARSAYCFRGCPHRNGVSPESWIPGSCLSRHHRLRAHSMIDP